MPKKNAELPNDTKKRRLSAFAILIFATFLIRGGVLFSSLDSFNDDPDDYRRLAENWYSFGVFGTEKTATAFRPPLYPWTLQTLVPLRASSERPPKVDATVKTDKPGAFQRFFDAKIALSRNASIALWHWILGVATVAVAYRIGRKLGFGPNAAAVGAFFVAVDPILLQQSRFVMTETLATFFAATLILGTLSCVERRGAKVSSVYFGALGLAFGLSILCRPAFFAFAGLVFLYFVAVELRLSPTGGRRSPAEKLDEPPQLEKTNSQQKEDVATKSHKLGAPIFPSVARVAAFLVGIAAVVAPWAVRNEREFGRLILTTTHDGYTLYLANNPEIYEHYRVAPFGTLWNPDEFHRRRAVDYANAATAANIKPNSKEAELFQNEWTRAEAKTAITAEPSTFLLASGIRFTELWRVLPNDVDAPTAPSKSAFSLKTAARYAVAAFYSLEWAFAALGCVALFLFARNARQNPQNRQNRASFARAADALLASRWLVGFLLVASVQIPHLIYWTNMRMRAPLEIFLPFLAIFGGIALDAAARKVGNRKTS